MREQIVPQSEVIRAIVLEDSPCCEDPHLIFAAERVKARIESLPVGRRRLATCGEHGVGENCPIIDEATMVVKLRPDCDYVRLPPFDLIAAALAANPMSFFGE